MRLVLAMIPLAITACTARPAPCAAPTCGAGLECLANRCVQGGSEPVPGSTQRIVLTPVACTTARGEALSGSVTLGDERAPDTRLYVRFGAFEPGGEVLAAFLLIEPASDRPRSLDDVPLEVWSLEGGVRGEEPALVAPHADGLARSAPPTIVRIDVTELARRLSRARHDAGLAVLSPSARGRGIALSTGAARTQPPRLEIYVRGAGTTARAW